jgi:beta-N-acetylhexosaminidase
MIKKGICVMCAALLLLTACTAKEEAGQPNSSAQEAQQSSSQQSSEVSAESEEESIEESLEESEESSEALEQPDQEIEQRLAGMSLEEKIGQMFFARFTGADTAAYYAEEYQLGGYVLFAVDFEGYTKEQVISHIDGCQAVSNTPMLMGVDEEGGRVVRVSQYFREEPFASPRDVYAAGGWDAIISTTEEKCALLKELHLNVNLAPVCDLAGDPEDFMYTRSFSGDPELAADFVGRTVSIMKEQGVGASLKHFPGYGDNVDTHTGIAVDSREASAFYERDFKPFLEGIQKGAGSVMVSHNIVNCFDSEYPASLSPKVHQILREELGYEGVIITDDLAMGAILDYCGEVDAAVLAVEAGNDLLISTEFESQYAAVLSAVQSGRITEERIDESVRRILLFKKQIGIL